MNKKVAWFSGGVSSFISIYLTKDIDEIIYIHIDNQHPDTLRFLHDCENVLDRKITILQSEYKSVENVIETFRFINSPYGAKCTNILKTRVRKAWEKQHEEYDITYVWGYDADEKHRAERLVNNHAEFKHEFPLIERGLKKQDVHGILAKLGIKRPLMYELGYTNNNCVGCVKGGMGYWNKIREDFPEVFERMAILERKINATCIKDSSGSVFLDELDPKRGRMEEEIMEDCGFFCEITFGETHE